MQDALALFREFQPWHWWALGAVFIGIEIMTPTFYFLWPGIAACIVGVLLYFIPGINPNLQLLLFALLAVFSTVLWKRLAPTSWTTTEPHPTLNRRTAQYEGRQARAAGDFSGGRGAILIDDTRWSAMAADGVNPMAGDIVIIIGADGPILMVRKVMAPA